MGHASASHTYPVSIGILITNTGTPEAPTAAALRRFLAEFLSDSRIVELPRWLWSAILRGVILNVRPRRSARLYQQIWTEDGSPLMNIARAQANAIHERLTTLTGTPIHVDIGMRYGSPSISTTLKKLRDHGARRLLIYPLFPQFSQTTTASAFDAVFGELRKWPQLYPLRTITQYHDHSTYIQALVNSIQEHWRKQGKPERLLFSFHGIPQSYAQAGDPYDEHCYDTASLAAEALGLGSEEWQVAFQSRFGPQVWLQPYSDAVLQEWGENGIKNVNVVCPGFSADCLETLYEVDVEMRNIFQSAGGREFHYIPALNTRPDHIRALSEVIFSQIEGWLNDQEA